MTPFDIWSPIFRAPFSGNVTQEISPQLFSSSVQGVPEIEHKIQTDVASYGKQLGKILEALQELSANTNTPLPATDDLVEKVAATKAECKEELRAHAAKAVARLQAADPEGLVALFQDTVTEKPPEG